VVYILQKKRKMKEKGKIYINLIVGVLLVSFISQLQLIISQDLGFGKGGGEIVKSFGDLNRKNDSWLREEWLEGFGVRNV